MLKICGLIVLLSGIWESSYNFLVLSVNPHVFFFYHIQTFMKLKFELNHLEIIDVITSL